MKPIWPGERGGGVVCKNTNSNRVLRQSDELCLFHW